MTATITRKKKTECFCICLEARVDYRVWEEYRIDDEGVSIRRIFNVSTAAATESALNTANAGDEIIIDDGTYTSWGTVQPNSGSGGALNNPVVVRAQTPGGVIFDGDNAYWRLESCQWITFQDFIYRNRTGSNQQTDLSGNRIWLCHGTTSNVRVTECEFHDLGVDINQHMYAIMLIGELGPAWAENNEFDHNDVHDCKCYALIDTRVRNLDTNAAGRFTHVHHNIWTDCFDLRYETSGAIWPLIRHGAASDHTHQFTNQTVEFDTFIRCQCVPDVVHDKASGTTVRGCYFEDSPMAIVMRHGEGHLIERNTIVNSENHATKGAIRIAAFNCTIRNNLIYNNDTPAFNYAICCTAISQDSGISDGHGTDETAAHDNLIEHNTVFGMKDNPNQRQFSPAVRAINWRDRPGAIRPHDSIARNNIIVQSEGPLIEALGESDPYPESDGNVIDRNLFHATGSASVPHDGTNPIFADPLFVNEAGFDFKLQAGSPAIDVALNSGAIEDIDGVVRPQGAVEDLGAYERLFAILRKKIKMSGGMKDMTGGIS